MTAKPTTTAGLPERAAGAFFRWEFPEEAIAVDFHLNVIELLERDAMRARGKMAGGFLLGRANRSRGLTLIVEHYEPLTPERGISDSPFADRGRMESLMNRWRPGHSRLSLIGLYRTCTPQTVLLTNDDLAALAADANRKVADVISTNLEGSKLSPQATTPPAADPVDSERVFLLIDAGVGGATSKAVLHLTRGETVLWQSPQTLFNRNELSKRRTASQPQVSEMRPPAVAPRELAFEGEETPARPKADLKGLSVLKWSIAAVGVAALLVTGFLQFRGTSAPHSLPQTISTDSSDVRLGLKLEQSGAAWRLTWNPESPALLKATKGRLIVTDGGMHKTIDLDSSDLRGGAIVYSPITEEVVLRLEVDSLDSPEPVSESVRTVGGVLPSTPELLTALSPAMGQTGSQPPLPLAPDPVTMPDLKGQPVLTVPSNTPGIPVRTVKSQPPSNVISKSLLPVITEIRPAERHAIVAAKVEAPPTAQPRISKSPAADVEARPTAKRPIITVKAAPVSPVRPAVSKNSVLPAAEATSPERRPIVAAHVERSPTGPKPGPSWIPEPIAIDSGPAAPAPSEAVHHSGVTEVAQLISKKDPDYPASAREARVSGSVEVSFTIDTNGEVRDVTVMKGPSLLASAAVDAVQTWRYKPARLDGVPVVTQASAVIVFRAN
jgi:protein TonB